MRVCLFFVLLFGVAFSIHAHSANLDNEPNADRPTPPGKTRSISDRDAAGGAITPATNFRRIEITATAPDPDTTELRRTFFADTVQDSERPAQNVEMERDQRLAWRRSRRRLRNLSQKLQDNC